MDNTYAVEVGSRIVQARKELNLTQVELAELAGVSQRAMQGYENGERIPYRKMADISGVVNKPMAWILHGEKAMIGSDEQLSRIEESLNNLAEAVRSLTDQSGKLLERDPCRYVHLNDGAGPSHS